LTPLALSVPFSTKREMSGQGYPFQADALAFARWDYCQIPEAVPDISDPLSCALRTRQCGSHIAATGDKRWMGRASAALAGRLEPAVVTGWSGKEGCVEVDAQGSCNLMTSGRYGPALWTAFGRKRAAHANDTVLRAETGEPPRPAPLGGDEQITPPVFGSTAWLVQHYG